jgi:hypothetical protein
LFKTSGTVAALPYEFIIDMTKAMILKDRRNFGKSFVSAVENQFDLVFDRNYPMDLPLIDVWEHFHGHVVSKNYRSDKCFPIKLDDEISSAYIKKIRLNKGDIKYQWEYSAYDLLGFYADARFRGFLHKAGFTTACDQLQLSLVS